MHSAVSVVCVNRRSKAYYQRPCDRCYELLSMRMSTAIDVLPLMARYLLHPKPLPWRFRGRFGLGLRPICHFCQRISRQIAPEYRPYGAPAACPRPTKDDLHAPQICG